MSIGKVNIREKFGLFSGAPGPGNSGGVKWSAYKSRQVTQFVWHRHEKEDEMFLVIKGVLKMEFRERTVVVGEGEFIMVPGMVEHRPVADEEVEVLLFEPAFTLNTGNVLNGRTKKEPEKI